MPKPITKPERVAAEIARVVGAGRELALDTVDFADPVRPHTCLEVDFPIVPVNEVAAIEGNAGKPIYQMSKWWARRRSSVFRSLLIAAATKAPEDPARAAKAVWDAYYANHQAKGAFSHLRVADIFMGGGTTIVEGSRLGMQMFGVDLNPVAWFIVRNEMARVDPKAVQALLADVEREVKPQVAPFYATDCPRGHRGEWRSVTTGEVMKGGFQPLALSSEERGDYTYQGPEIIYVFWAKHGPCEVAACGHRTPILSSPVVAVKTLTVKAWDVRCSVCQARFDVEDGDARMAPGVPLTIVPGQRAWSVLDDRHRVSCPHCGHRELRKLSKETNKKIELTLLVHPEWMAGSPGTDAGGRPYGGRANDTPEATAAWNRERAQGLRLLEVRGPLPDTVTCPETGVTFSTSRGTVPKKSHFACQAPTCGREQDVLTSIRATGDTGPMAAYAIQGFCPTCKKDERPYDGRFFATVSNAGSYDAVFEEWARRRDGDLALFWPRSEVPFGFMTTLNNGGIANHGFTHWWKMFNPRQLLVHSQLLRAIATTGRHAHEAREFVLGAFQQYLRNQNLFCIWNVQADKLEPHFSNNNYHPKSTPIENCVFGELGRGNWTSCAESLSETASWALSPWERVSSESVAALEPALKADLSGKSQRVATNDPVTSAVLLCGSATELPSHETASFDLVVTDPPFGGLLHYSELADFFHVWLRLVLNNRYPVEFGPELTPKSLEAVTNRARVPDAPEAFYQRLLTSCWKEAHRVLKPGGLLAFTFHHSEDEPWVAVLESLFEAGFYLEGTYPIRSDETKGEGAKPGTFGSQKIEYDIIHVCRKRTEDARRVSWGRMRREVLEDVRRLQALIEHHAKSGLPAADLQVIRRGKALEYYSRHYGRVLLDEDRLVSVREALLGINQLLEEGGGTKIEPPPANAEPFTRQFLRVFAGRDAQPRDQMSKHLRGTGVAPEEFEQRGWCREEKKVYRRVPALELAREWHGKPRKKMSSDFDQAMFCIGGCVEGSGIAVNDTLKSDGFRPHPALRGLIEWHVKHGGDAVTRSAAARALAIYRSWERTHQHVAQQLQLFDAGP
jgi:putative DNA methylase